MAGLNHESWNFIVLVCGLIMGALIASSHTFLADRHLFLVEILFLIVSGFLLTVVRPERPWKWGLAIWLGYFVISEIREIYDCLHTPTSTNLPLPIPIILVLFTVLFALYGGTTFLGAWLGYLLRNFLMPLCH
jgi:hypothetical protein